MCAPMTKDTPELRRMSRSLEETDPEIAAVLRNEAPPPGHRPRADPLREFRLRSGDGSDGLGPDQQVCRRLSRQALLRRLRIRRSGRAAGHRPRQGALRRRARQRAAALRHAGEHRRLYDRAEAGRHRAGHESRARRPPDARPSAEFFRQDVQFRALRRRERNRNDRLRRARPPGARAQAENDRGRSERLFAHLRFPAHGADRAVGGRAAVRGHGAHRGTHRHRRASESGAPCRLRRHHHAQDAARPARRPDSLPRKVRQGS